MRKEILFNGITYKLMGNARYYLSNFTTNDERKKVKGLHVAVWEFYSGRKVKKDWVVHHKDGDYSNNQFSNLECISHKKHMKMHEDEKRARGSTKKQLKHLENIRSLAAKWHQSPEGLAWHKTQARTRKGKTRLKA